MNFLKKRGYPETTQASDNPERLDLPNFKQGKGHNPLEAEEG